MSRFQKIEVIRVWTIAICHSMIKRVEINVLINVKTKEWMSKAIQLKWNHSFLLIKEKETKIIFILRIYQGRMISSMVKRLKVYLNRKLRNMEMSQV